ncbi:MAG: HAD-IA family hydrolase [Chloroflexota bacterium]|nr:HAD-IA family hydrolase [Chloroflexota bacterium]
MIRALIFDFDGLIVETETPALESWQEIFQEFGQELTPERWDDNVGRGERIDIVGLLEQLTDRSLDAEALTARRRARHVEMVEAQPILPGVLQCIADAHAMGFRLAVASSSSRQWVAGHLDRLGLIRHFDAVRCRDDADVGVGKPDPAVYLAAMRALGVAPNQTIAFEDSPRGVQAARTAGIFTVAIPNDVTRRMGDAGADLTLNSMADMTLAEIVRVTEAQG